jgi:hypothetical protein
MRRSRKPIYPQGYRGFESLPLRLYAWLPGSTSRHRASTSNTSSTSSTSGNPAAVVKRFSPPDAPIAGPPASTTICLMGALNRIGLAGLVHRPAWASWQHELPVFSSPRRASPPTHAGGSLVEPKRGTFRQELVRGGHCPRQRVAGVISVVGRSAPRQERGHRPHASGVVRPNRAAVPHAGREKVSRCVGVCLTR